MRTLFILPLAVVAGLSLACGKKSSSTTSNTSQDDGSGGNSGGGGTTACDSGVWGGGFNLASTGMYISNASSSTLNSVTVYFMASASGSLGTKSITATAYSCGFGGTSIGSASTSVNLQLVDNYYSATFNFGGASIPSCSGSNQVTLKFTNSSGGTVYYGGTTNSACAGSYVSADITSNPATPYSGPWYGVLTYN